jgi:hypothetical protein
MKSGISRLKVEYLVLSTIILVLQGASAFAAPTVDELIAIQNYVRNNPANVGGDYNSEIIAESIIHLLEHQRTSLRSVPLYNEVDYKDVLSAVRKIAVGKSSTPYINEIQDSLVETIATFHRPQVADPVVNFNRPPVAEKVASVRRPRAAAPRFTIRMITESTPIQKAGPILKGNLKPPVSTTNSSVCVQPVAGFPISNPAGISVVKAVVESPATPSAVQPKRAHFQDIIRDKVIRNEPIDPAFAFIQAPDSKELNIDFEWNESWLKKE